MPVVVDALRALDVPVRAICDIDVLRDEQPLRRIIEALGAEWDTVEPDWRVVKSTLDSQPRQNPSLEAVRDELAARSRPRPRRAYAGVGAGRRTVLLRALQCCSSRIATVRASHWTRAATGRKEQRNSREAAPPPAARRSFRSWFLWRSVETRWRVTPKRSAICSIASPSVGVDQLSDSFLVFANGGRPEPFCGPMCSSDTHWRGTAE